MEAAGADVIQSFQDVSVMGFSEALGALPKIIKIRKKLARFMASEKIDLFVPIDFPGFNGGLAGKARQSGVAVFWLIAPQHWAWGSWRTGGFRKRVSRLGTILPFEEKYFQSRGLDVFPMGHPLMDDYGGDFPFEKQLNQREKALSHRDLPLNIGIFPGSRHQELKQLLPIFKVTSQALLGHLAHRQVKFLVSAAPGVDPIQLSEMFSISAEIIQAPLLEILPKVDMAYVCSGTASLEVALAGVPHELVYKTGSFNNWVGKRLVKSDRIGLSNIILQEDLVREHLQENAAPLPLARDLLRWMARPAERQSFYHGVRKLRNICGAPGVWERTAREALEMMSANKSGA